jgi:DNA-binding NtrC family response regulator
MIQPEGSKKTTTTRGSNKTVLVVDDNEIVLDYAAAVLRRADYHVMTAHGPELALYVAEHYPRTIDLLLTDYEMPQLDGVELAHKLTEDRPQLRVLVMSGRYRGDIPLPATAEFIGKPFTTHALLSLVENVLTTACDMPEKKPVRREVGHAADNAAKCGGSGGNQ